MGETGGEDRGGVLIDVGRGRRQGDGDAERRGQVQQSGDGDQKDPHDRKGQESGVGGGEIRREGGTGVLFLRQIPGQGAEEHGQEEQQHHQGDARRISGDGQSGAGFKAGVELEQPQHQRGGAAQDGCQRKRKFFFHIQRVLSEVGFDQNARKYASQYSTPGAVCPCRSTSFGAPAHTV